jgi:serine/threonine protein kinase
MSAQPQAKRLGKYEIIELVGRGGFGEVYRARDLLLNRIVAVKILSPNALRDPAFIARFRQEAQAAANLSHPNIVIIHELVEGQGAPYMAMEFLEGASLDKVIKSSGAMPLSRASAIIAQVASALDYAHSRGLVHRDIKPSNIIIGPNDHATLTDFGLVKAALSESLSASGQIVGTPEYMAPEQAESKAVDARTDVYSLGIVLFRVLAGKLPFEAQSALSMLYKQVHEPPPDLRTLRPDLPNAVAAVVARALAKNPDGRFPSAGALSAALAAADRKGGAQPRPQDTGRGGAQPRPQPPTGQGTWLRNVALLVTFVATAVITGAWVLRGVIWPPPSPAPTPLPTNTPAIATSTATPLPPTATRPPTATPLRITATPIPPTSTRALTATQTARPSPSSATPTTSAVIINRAPELIQAPQNWQRFEVGNGQETSLYVTWQTAGQGSIEYTLLIRDASAGGGGPNISWYGTALRFSTRNTWYTLRLLYRGSKSFIGEDGRMLGIGQSSSVTSFEYKICAGAMCGQPRAFTF